MKLRKINAVLPQDTEQQVIDSVRTMKESLPFLISLTQTERIRLAKLSRRRQDFIDKALIQAEQNPGLVPPHCNVEEFRTTMETITGLLRLDAALAPFISQLRDTTMYVRAQAYEYARAFYNAVKASAKHSVPGAQDVVDDLSYHFKSSPQATPTPELPEEPEQPNEIAA